MKHLITYFENRDPGFQSTVKTHVHTSKTPDEDEEEDSKQAKKKFSPAARRRRPRSAPAPKKRPQQQQQQQPSPKVDLRSYSKSLRLLGFDIPSNRREATKLTHQVREKGECNGGEIDKYLFLLFSGHCDPHQVSHCAHPPKAQNPVGVGPAGRHRRKAPPAKVN